MSMNYVSFNQDYSHMAVGTSSGFRIYYTDPFAKCYSTHSGNVSLLEMLFSTSLVALVLSPRRLVITNTKRQSTICELTFPTSILGVRLNRKRLVVVLEDQIYLYDISNMKLVHTIDTAPNPAGICALSPSSERCYLAYPLPQRAAPAFAAHTPAHVPPTSPHHHAALTPASGHVMIFDALALTPVNVIEAHRAPLSCMAMSADGSRLATASDKGTVIRVFSVPDAHKLAQFRRGSLPARIYSMAFNAMASLLCVSSGSETVHVFKLAPDGGAVGMGVGPGTAAARSPSPSGRRPPNRGRSQSQSSEAAYDDERDADLGRSMGPDSSSATVSSSTAAGGAERAHDGSFAGMLRRTSQSVSKTLAARVGGYLPTSVSEMLEPQRDFAWFKLPRSNTSSGPMRSVVALSSNSPQVMVVTSDGVLLVYNIDLERGGEGTLVRQFAVMDEDEGVRTGRLDE